MITCYKVLRQLKNGELVSAWLWADKQTFTEKERGLLLTYKPGKVIKPNYGIIYAYASLPRAEWAILDSGRKGLQAWECLGTESDLPLIRTKLNSTIDDFITFWKNPGKDLSRITALQVGVVLGLSEILLLKRVF